MSTTKFKVAAVNALRTSMKAENIVALNEIRDNVKAVQLMKGDLVVNILTQRVEAIDNIEIYQGYIIVNLTVAPHTHGGQFTLDNHDRIDVYRA